MDVNDLQRKLFTDRIFEKYGNNLSGKTIALWGLAFKPNTDDIREAPALYLIDELLKAGAKVRAYDPEAIENVKRIYGEKVYFATDEYDALSGADFLVVVTEWNEFRSPDFDKIKSLLKEQVVFDGRNVYSLDQMKQLGFYYESIGRSTIDA
jgi:UDPglucose 6-dehydrogenase